MTNLKELTLKELSAKALEMKLTLSYKGEDGKRKRYTKQQLIEMIEAKQAAKVEAVEVVQTETVETVQVEKVETNIVETTPVTNKEVIAVASEQIAKGNLDIVKGLLNKLNNYINNERKNKLLVTKMSNFRNVIVAKLKQAQRKGVVSYG